jgi:hypothetical protein
MSLRACFAEIPSCRQRQHYEEAKIPNNDACLVAESIR